MLSALPARDDKDHGAGRLTGNAATSRAVSKRWNGPAFAESPYQPFRFRYGHRGWFRGTAVGLAWAIDPVKGVFLSSGKTVRKGLSLL